MSNRRKDLISRKEFLKRTSASLAALGMMGGVPARALGAEDVEREAETDPPAALRELGRTGLKVTPLAYGASRTLDLPLVRAALDRGINFIDTGRSYFKGKNEGMVAKAVAGRREKYVIQSKVGLRFREDDFESPDIDDRITAAMNKSLDASLKALATDYIDVLLLHGPSTPAEIENGAVTSFFSEAKKKGKIRACGFSTHANQVELMRSANKSGFYDVVMVTFNHKGSFVHSRSGRYSEWDQKALVKELKAAAAKNIGIVAMKTCSAGPYGKTGDAAPSFGKAVRWVVDHDFVHSAAVAMVDIQEIDEICSAVPLAEVDAPEAGEPEER